MALKEILNNAKYADDLILTLPSGETLTVGEMRAQTADDRRQLLERQQLVEQAELAIMNKVNEFQAAGLLPGEGVKAAKSPSDKQMRTAAASEFGLDENDPLLGEVVKEMKKEFASRDARLDSVVNELKASLQNVVGVVKTAVQANLDETYSGDFAKATKGLPKGIEVKYEDAYKYAETRGLKDKYGRYDISEAVELMTAKQVLDAERKALRAEVEAEVEKKGRLAGVSRPTAASPANHRPKTGFDPTEKVKDVKTGREREVTKSFEQAIAEAMNDDDLFSSAMSTASFGVVQ